MRVVAQPSPDPTLPAVAVRAVRVTIVMLTYNRGELVECSLRSLFAQTYRPLQIVIVDDASTDDTLSVVEALASSAPDGVRIRIVKHDRNYGIGRGRNSGIDAADGEVIAFIDDDCVAQPNWVAELVRPFTTDVGIAITGGRIDEPADRTWAQAAAEGINYLGTREGDVRAVVGCNMALRSSFLARRPFDATVRYGADELDLCFAAADDGLRVHFTPAARVTHHHRRSVSAFLKQQFARGKGAVWVRRKHGRGLWPQKNWVVLALIVALAAAPLLPSPFAMAAPTAALVLFVAQVLYLDHRTGKPLTHSLWTLPLVLPGYVVEFCGGAAEIVRSALMGDRPSSP